MDKTSVAGGITLPLGASASVISAAKKVIQKHGNEALDKVAKLHFKTTQQVIGDLT
jgi:ribonuclease HIII